MAETIVEIKLDNVKIGEYKYGDALTAEKLAQIYASGAYCGGETEYYNLVKPAVSSQPPISNFYSAVGGAPFTLSRAYNDYYMYFNIPDSEGTTKTGLKILYIYKSGTASSDNIITPATIGNYYPVTFLDMQHVLIDCHAPQAYHTDNDYMRGSVTWEGYAGTEWDSAEKPNFLNAQDKLRYYKDEIKEVTDFTTDYVDILEIAPYAIIDTGDGLVLCRLDICAGYNGIPCRYTPSVSATSNAFNTVNTFGGTTTCALTRTPSGEFTNFASADPNVMEIRDGKADRYIKSDKYGYNIEMDAWRIDFWYAPCNLESFMELHKNTGAYLLADKVYKPIISGGWVTEYTDDLSAASDLDNFDGNMSHEIPDVPPSPKTPDDGIDDMTLGYNSYENGMVNYYIMSVGDIETLVTDISNQLLYPHLIQNIVSLKSYSMSLNDFYTGATANNIQVGKFATTANGTKITSTVGAVQVASFEVNGNYGTRTKPHFLDYAPYTKLEVYIPFCGSIPLPPEVMYNTIQIWLVSDITSGSCIGVVKCNGNIVAQKSGIIGTQIPITTTDSAQQNYAMLQGVMNGVQAGATTLISGATGNVVGMIAGTMQGVANIGQQIIAGNENYTQTVGTTGDKSVYAMPAYAYLKRWRAVDVSDENYNRTYGRPCCKTKKLTAGDGFTIVDNPRVTGNMTLAEKNEIEGYLKTGVIL